MESSLEPPAFADELPDDELRLLFACCHPALSEEGQVTLTLKVACGFSVREIALALLADEPAVAQRLVRAKRTLRAPPHRDPRGPCPGRAVLLQRRPAAGTGGRGRNAHSTGGPRALASGAGPGSGGG